MIIVVTLQQVIGFLIAALLITASPGSDNLMVLGMGMSRGRRQGVAFGLGCAFGCVSHTLLAVAGISALIAASPLALTLLKGAGGLYLIWMGYRAWRSAGGVRTSTVAGNEEPLAKIFLRGCIANAINPKVALFFLSFLPQFVIASNGHVAGQVAWLGILFTIQAGILFGCLGLFPGVIGQWLNSKPAAGVILDRVAGTVFIGLGLRIMLGR
jgi:threonine/homoserine/homoserine lactone efflux protein